LTVFLSYVIDSGMFSLVLERSSLTSVLVHQVVAL